MKKIVLVAAILLASCGTSPEKREEKRARGVNVPTVVAVTASGNDVVKFCDQGRAIYTVEDDNSAALAVVQNATECAR